MDLQKEWNNMNDEVIVNSEAELAAAGQFIKAESAQLLTTLEKNLKMKLMWARLIAVAILIGAYFAHGSMRYWLLAAVLVYELGRYLMVKRMKNLNYEPDYSHNTAELISEQLEVIRKTLKVEEIWGYLIIPFAGPFGYILSGLHKGKTFSGMLAEPNSLFILLAFMGLALLGIALGKKMNRIAFGKYIDKLNTHLEQMQAD